MWQEPHYNQQFPLTLVRNLMPSNFFLTDYNVYTDATEKEEKRDRRRCPCPCTDLTICNNALRLQECFECKPTCTNTRITDHNFTPLDNFYLKDLRRRGLALFTSEPIEENTMIMEITGEVITIARFAERSEQHHGQYGGFKFYKRHILDPYRYGNMGRFVHHTCLPNCRPELWKLHEKHHVMLVASKRIEADEELSISFNELPAFNNGVNLKCLCRRADCPDLDNSSGSDDDDDEDARDDVPSVGDRRSCDDSSSGDDKDEGGQGAALINEPRQEEKPSPLQKEPTPPVASTSKATPRRPSPIKKPPTPVKVFKLQSPVSVQQKIPKISAVLPPAPAVLPPATPAKTPSREQRENTPSRRSATRSATTSPVADEENNDDSSATASPAVDEDNKDDREEANEQEEEEEEDVEPNLIMCEDGVKGIMAPRRSSKKKEVVVGPIKCRYPPCPTHFETAAAEKSHFYSYHKDDEKLKCHLCSNSFATPRTLQHHLDNIHNPEKPKPVRAQYATQRRKLMEENKKILAKAARKNKPPTGSVAQQVAKKRAQQSRYQKMMSTAQPTIPLQRVDDVKRKRDNEEEEDKKKKKTAAIKKGSPARSTRSSTAARDDEEEEEDTEPITKKKKPAPKKPVVSDSESDLDDPPT